MQIYYKNTELTLYKNGKKIDFDINKDVDTEFLKYEFNQTISKLSMKHNSLAYWLMRLSERNTLTHHLFLDICKIMLLKKLGTQHLVVYTNNVAIYDFFQKTSTITLQDRYLFQKQKFFNSYKPYLYLITFLLKKFFFKLRYSHKKYAKDLSDTTIIQTWVSDTNFKNNTFKDSYYGDLAKYLRENGKTVITWPVFYNVKNKTNAISYIRKNKSDFLVIEDYLKWQDYFQSTKHFFQKRFLKLGSVKILENDFTSLFHYYQKQETIEMSSFFYSFTQRVKSSQNITFIQNHENMIGEKALALGVQKYLQTSKIIGYFHTTKPKNQLCLEYATSQEYKISPKPNAIVFNSYKFKDYYKTKYPNLLTYNGIALKQLHMQQKQTNEQNREKKILILFSGTKNDVILMFHLLNTLDDNYSFIFRTHPMLRFDIKAYYTKENYTLENDIPLNTLFNQVSKVIATYSAVALEAALSGLNVGLVYDKKRLLINPFDDTGIKNYMLLSTKEDIKKFLTLRYTQQNVKQIFNIKSQDYNIFKEL